MKSYIIYKRNNFGVDDLLANIAYIMDMDLLNEKD